MSDLRPTLERWGVTIEDLSLAIDENPSLRGMVLGYVAEYKLRRMWFSDQARITHHVKPDDHSRKKKGDLAVTYKGRAFAVESKSLQTSSIRRRDGRVTGKAQVDASDKRAVTFRDGSMLTTTCLLAGEFDPLAVNLFAFADEWRFVFAKNRDLPLSTFRKYTPAQRAELLASMVPVSWPPDPPFRAEPFGLLDELLADPVALAPPRVAKIEPAKTVKPRRTRGGGASAGT